MPEKEIDVFNIDEINKASAKEQEVKRDRDINDIRKILKMPEGRRLFWRLLSEAGVFRASFSLNSMQTSFNEGKRDNGLQLLAEMHEAEPMAYSQMLREHYSEAKSKKKQED